jgi:hypothetical protein
MRMAILSSAAVLALLAGPIGTTMAQTAAPDTSNGARPGNVIGSGQSLPTSPHAGNINAAGSPGMIAPRLPTPAISEDANPRRYLLAAQAALNANHTGMAQESLERAETRVLSRSVVATTMGQPIESALAQQIHGARDALGAGNRGLALQQIDAILKTSVVASMPE